MLGSFESWAEVIGGILEVCGLPGFLENENELTTRDDHALGWSALVAEWWSLHQTSLVSIDNLHEIIVRNAELEVAFSGTLGQGLDRSQKRKLGEELRRVEGRVFGSWRVEIVVGCTVPRVPALPASAPRAAPRARENARAKPNHTPSRAAPRRAHARASRRREPRRGLGATAHARATGPSPTTHRAGLPRAGAHARAGRRRRGPAPARPARNRARCPSSGSRRK